MASDKCLRRLILASTDYETTRSAVWGEEPRTGLTLAVIASIWRTEGALVSIQQFSVVLLKMGADGRMDVVIHTDDGLDEPEGVDVNPHAIQFRSEQKEGFTSEMVCLVRVRAVWCSWR